VIKVALSEDIRRLFIEKEALLSGHFLLSSGLHSETYLQAAKVLQYPEVATRLGKQLAGRFEGVNIDVVVAPALGGILVSFEAARALGVRSLFVERKEGGFCLRRGFEIRKAERVLVVEDVVTTGKSTNEVIEVIRQGPGELAGVGCIVDRSGGKAGFGVPLKSLLKIDVKTYDPSDCPLCRKGLPAVKPGSRG